MAALDDLKKFNCAEAQIALWTFKKQSTAGEPPQYNGHWIDTTDKMDVELRSILSGFIENVTEVIPFSLLAQNNESSALSILADETHVPSIIEKTSAESAQRKTRSIKTLRNAKFYVVKYTIADRVVRGFRKTDSTWRTATATNVLTAFFSDNQLDIASDTGFQIHKNFDFVTIDDEILIRHKNNFESVLEYKAAHEDDFAEMSAEAAFLDLFTGIDELTAFVGSNKIQLRRMSSIRQKGFYKDPDFMKNVKSDHAEYGLKINFSDEGKITPCEFTCRDIMSALLDHRLRSGFSGNNYEVPDATKV